MGYKKRDVLHAVEKSVNRGLRDGEWCVYDEPPGTDYYDGAAAGTISIGVVPRGTYYRPLVDREELLTDFARQNLETPGVRSYSTQDLELATPYVFSEYDHRRLETARNEQAAREWARRNGPLFDRREDPVWRYVAEWWRAKRALELYEDATSAPDPEKRIWTIGLELEGHHTPQDARQEALCRVALIVEGMVAEHCYPTIRRQGDGIAQGWGFHNLLGAIWLQMMFLVTDGADRRCIRPGCNRSISPAARKDRAYCTDSCKTLASRERNKQR